MSPTPPVATGAETIQALLKRSKRKGAVPLRRLFVQRGTQQDPAPGPLAELVRHRDERGLELYLLVKTLASKDPWTVSLPAGVWARALELHHPKNGPTAVSRTFRRLEERGLIARSRSGRLLEATVLLEDGSRLPYGPPERGRSEDHYFKLPFAYWTAKEAWHKTLSLPARALLLIALSLKDGFVLPYERMPEWYGLSADTAQRGLGELSDRGLLRVDSEWITAPLAPRGYTERRHYTLCPPFGPRGSVSDDQTA